jgi:hypothetical protein
VRRGFGTIIALALVLAGCSSGPSYEALLRNEPPPTTTTTTLPPEGVVLIAIENGKFTPAVLNIQLEKQWLVRWTNSDPPREYILECRGVFESPVLKPGDTFEFDFSGLEPAIYRYHTFIGNQRIPGMVDTRPER